MKRVAALWTVAALCGIAVTAAVTWGASRLFSQPIGLTSEPPSVIKALAPSASHKPRRPLRGGAHRSDRRPAGRAPSPSPAVASTPALPTATTGVSAPAPAVSGQRPARATAPDHTTGAGSESGGGSSVPSTGPATATPALTGSSGVASRHEGESDGGGGSTGTTGSSGATGQTGRDD